MTFRPSDWGKLVYNGFQYPRHIQLLEDSVLDLLYLPHKNRLVVSMPVQHGKSTYCSNILPGWFMLMHPGKNILHMSHTATFAQNWGLTTRNRIEQYGPQLAGQTTVAGKRSTNEFWLTAGGEYFCCGANGAPSGHKADLVILDDLVKDDAEAQSPDQREKLWKKLHEDILSRLSPTAKVLMVMSRRHSSDVCGKAISSNLMIPANLKWHEIRMPALDEKGQALWPEYKSAEWLRAIRDEKVALGLDWQWEALYQQNPVGDPTMMAFPPEYTEGIEYDERPPTDIIWDCISIDPSQGRHDDQGDYTAMWHVILDSNGNYWCDAGIVRRIPSAEIPEVAIKFINEVRPRSVSIETNGDQQVIHEYLVRELVKTEARNVPVYGKETKVKKESKIRLTLGPLLHQRRIKFMRGLFATQLTVQQLRDFPSGSFDDGADGATMAVLHIDERLRQARRR